MTATPAATAEAAAQLASHCAGSVTAGFGDVTVDVPAAHWVEALTLARDGLGLSYFDWLSAVDELDAGFSVLCHLAAIAVDPAATHDSGTDDSGTDDNGTDDNATDDTATDVRDAAVLGSPAGAAGTTSPHLVHLLVRTRVPLDRAVLATATGVFPGAGWHERETWEMFGIDFEGHPNLVPLLLPEGFVGRPLRKAFELQARLERPWPGAKDPAKGTAGR